MDDLEFFMGHVSGQSSTKPGGTMHHGAVINLAQLHEAFVQCRIIFQDFVIILVLPEPADLLRKLKYWKFKALKSMYWLYQGFCGHPVMTCRKGNWLFLFWRCRRFCFHFYGPFVNSKVWRLQLLGTGVFTAPCWLQLLLIYEVVCHKLDAL